jgi:hypothetical protein
MATTQRAPKMAFSVGEDFLQGLTKSFSEFSGTAKAVPFPTPVFETPVRQ